MTVTQQERIRGPHLVLKGRGAEVPMEEAIRRAEPNRVLARSQILDKPPVGLEKQLYSPTEKFCWSGTMVGYDKPGQPLGTAIVSPDQKTGVRYVFPVPKEHQGKKNVILVAEHPDFSLVRDGKDRVVQAAAPGIVERFPVSEDYFFGDPKYGIPQGNPVSLEHPDARCLFRSAGQYVGLVARNFPWDGSLRRYVDLCKSPSNKLLVLVEATLKQFLAELKKLHPLTWALLPVETPLTWARIRAGDPEAFKGDWPR